MNRLLIAAALLISLPAAAAEPLPFKVMGAAMRAGWKVTKLATKAAMHGDVLGAAGHLNPVNTMLIGYQELTAPHAHPNAPSTWAQSFHGASGSQRGMVGNDGKLYMRTELHVDAPSSKAAPSAAKQFAEPWSSWGYGGKYIKLSPAEYAQRTGRKAATGSITYELDPPAGLNTAPSGLIRVNEQLKIETHGDHMSGKLRLDGHIIGPAHVEVVADGNNSELVGGFDGVELGGTAKLLGPATIGLLHGAVEFQGFGNLARKLSSGR